MNNDEEIVKALENIQTGQKTLQVDVSSIKDTQQKQGERLEPVEAGQKELNAKVDNVELKVEAIHEYQKQVRDEILGMM
jgi:hypothetical protein